MAWIITGYSHGNAPPEIGGTIVPDLFPPSDEWRPPEGIVDDQKTRAVILSLGTDGRAPDSAKVPGDYRGGYWGDSFPENEDDGPFGGQMWLVTDRAELTDQTIPEVRRAIAGDLAWMVTDGIASKIDVFVERSAEFEGLAVRIIIDKGDALDFAFLWADE